MKLTLQIAATGLLLAILNPYFSTAHAQATAFTYQGRLMDGGNPANGTYDFKFVLYDSSTNGSQQGPILTNAAAAVSNGLFTVTLDFGNQFPGAARWLEISVGTNDAGSSITLNPRQPITAMPYAISAANVLAGGIPSGIYTNAVIFSNGNNQFAGNGANVTNIHVTSIAGGVPSGAAAGWVFTLTNATTGQGTWSNAPSGGFATNVMPPSLNLTNWSTVSTSSVAYLSQLGTYIPPTVATNTYIFYPTNGANDCTAYIQTNLLRAGNYLFMPGDYYVSNIVTASYQMIYGYNATLHMQPGAAGFLLYEPSNTINTYVYGLNLSGGQESYDWAGGGNVLSHTSDFFDINHPWVGSGNGLPFDQINLPQKPYFRNRSGFYVNAGGGGTIQDVTVSGFPGYAFLFINTNSTGNAMSSKRAYIRGCTAHDNFLGFWPSSSSFDFDPTGSAPDMNCEYFQIQHCNACNNTFGVSIAAGNNSVVGGQFTHNWVAVISGGGHNVAHGVMSSCTINHNYIGFWGSSVGELISDCVFYAQSGWNFYADAWAGGQVDNCIFGGVNGLNHPGITITNDYAFNTVTNAFEVFFKNNTLSGTTWSNEVANGYINFKQCQNASTNTVVYHWGNVFAGGQTDGNTWGGNTGISSIEYIQTNSGGPHGIIHTNQNGSLIGIGTY